MTGSESGSDLSSVPGARRLADRTHRIRETMAALGMAE